MHVHTFDWPAFPVEEPRAGRHFDSGYESNSDFLKGPLLWLDLLTYLVYCSFDSARDSVYATSNSPPRSPRVCTRERQIGKYFRDNANLTFRQELIKTVNVNKLGFAVYIHEYPFVIKIAYVPEKLLSCEFVRYIY